MCREAKWILESSRRNDVMTKLLKVMINRGYRTSPGHPICTIVANSTGMKHQKTETVISAIFCLLIMPLIFMLAPVEQWFHHNTLFLIALIIYMYALHFIYMKIDIPRMVKEKKFIQLALLLAAVICTTVLFTHFPFDYGSHISGKEIIYRSYLRTRIIWFFFIIVSSFSLVIKLTAELFRESMEKKEIENQNRLAELALYKAQINPHFLFNTMNSLYSMIITRSEKTEDAFIKFSDILKYMYSQAEKDTISISEEIRYLKEYIDLQELRLNGHTRIDLDIRANDDDLQVPTMLLITFVENAFKYGTSSSKDCSILIRLQEKDGILLFETVNDIMKRGKDGTGIGLSNCRKRLDVLYHNRYQLETREENGKYQVHLSIHLK